MPAKPNFLFLMTDQHRPDHTGFGGSPVARTPHLDRLAARSMRFDRAYVANPICMPNRATLLTGRQPSVHGTRINGVPLDWGTHTFVRDLKEAGWRTSLIGKAHFQNMGAGPPGAEDVIQGLFPAPGDAFTRPWPDGWDRFEDGALHRRERVKMPEDYYGFEHVELVVGHGDLCSGHYAQWLLEQGVTPEEAQGRAHAREHGEGWMQVYQPALPEALYPTSYVTHRALQVLERAALADDPFFLQVSYPDPHHPFTPPGRFWGMFEPGRVPLPETFDDPLDDAMPHLKRMRKHRGRAPRMVVAPWAPDADQYREAAAAELGMIAMIDEGVGALLRALDRLDLARNTVVVFTSDHGDMFGDHGILLKGAMHYEGCIRVPLLVATPELSGGVSRSLVGSVDVAPTLLELAGLPAFHGMQGRSLVPILRDPAARVRDHVLVEEDQPFDMVGLGQALRMRTLVTERARFTLYRGAEHGELFDLERDPQERHNLFGRPEGRALRGELTDSLARSLLEADDDAPKPGHLA